ncbi:hypothetical protein FHT78_004895 [Rhizobium sp. BK196]|jgi:hypothetical protein|uniref:hypothetical protein n=1 Tax=Rhizobium sp. BK196 TaxID=2587073 RepID=UPI0016220E74|nr:hypothetical protein [Rhizobium sp. BK196]MBB3313107.1 hypothetical protein [Rhizobium sp. BK196]
MRKAAAIGSALVLLAAGVSSAGIMDRSDCLNGPTSFGSGVGPVIDSLQKRLVACFNYGNEIEVENHNSQAQQIQMLAKKIDELESRLVTQELQISTLNMKISNMPH